MRASSVPAQLKAILGCMRQILPLAALLVVLVPSAWGLPPADKSDATPPAPLTAPSPDGDAAARHAKRTACLKEAKAKKLVGAQKSAFLRACFTAP
jgi:hypothetical protein